MSCIPVRRSKKIGIGDAKISDSTPSTGSSGSSLAPGFGCGPFPKLPFKPRKHKPKYPTVRMGHFHELIGNLEIGFNYPAKLICCVDILDQPFGDNLERNQYLFAQCSEKKRKKFNEKIYFSFNRKGIKTREAHKSMRVTRDFPVKEINIICINQDPKTNGRVFGFGHKPNLNDNWYTFYKLQADVHTKYLLENVNDTFEEGAREFILELRKTDQQLKLLKDPNSEPEVVIKKNQNPPPVLDQTPGQFFPRKRILRPKEYPAQYDELVAHMPISKIEAIGEAGNMFSYSQGIYIAPDQELFLLLEEQLASLTREMSELHLQPNTLTDPEGPSTSGIGSSSAMAPKPISRIGSSSAMAPKPISKIGSSSAIAPKPISKIGSSSAIAPKPISSIGSSSAIAPKPISSIGSSSAIAPKPISRIYSSAVAPMPSIINKKATTPTGDDRKERPDSKQLYRTRSRSSEMLTKRKKNE